MMNFFLAEKLGEVLAFTRIGIDTLERGKESIDPLFGDVTVESILEELVSHAESISVWAGELGAQERVFAKAEDTGKKLTAMRAQYLRDRWNEPAEVLEWMGLLEGGAIAHWSLVHGAAAHMKKNAGQWEDMSARAHDTHHAILKRSSAALQNPVVYQAEV